MKRLPPMGVSLYDCIKEAAANKIFVKEYDRLSGTNVFNIIYRQRTPTEIMIGKATKHEESEIAKFAAFVHKAVYTPLLHQYLSQQKLIHYI